MKEVILLNSPLFREYNPNYDEDALPPLGLGYLGTSLRRHGVKVDLIDAVDDRIPLKRLVNMLDEARPDVIASNIFTTNAHLVRELVENIPFKTHFIIGGLSTKQLYHEIFRWETTNPIDVVTGDGEYIIVDLVKEQMKEPPVCREGNKRFFQVGIGSVYEVKDISAVALDRSFFKNEPVKHPLGFQEANIVASRGCIFNCTFCAAARSLNNDYSVRERSVASIQNELSQINETFPAVNSIRVLDDLFLKHRESVVNAVRVFSNFGFQWRAMAHVLTFNKVEVDLLRELKQSGCFELFIGIESGSPRVLRQINKTSNIAKIIDNLSRVLSVGIHLKGYFIYGFPSETVEDMERTYTLARTLKERANAFGANFRTSVFQYRPYHGTQIFHDLETRGINPNVENVEPNPKLSDLVGRLQFNFHTGNFSEVSSKVLNNYIYRTTNLNDGNIFGDLQKNSNPV